MKFSGSGSATAAPRSAAARAVVLTTRDQECDSLRHTVAHAFTRHVRFTPSARLTCFAGSAAATAHTPTPVAVVNMVITSKWQTMHFAACKSAVRCGSRTRPIQCLKPLEHCGRVDLGKLRLKFWMGVGRIMGRMGAGRFVEPGY